MTDRPSKKVSVVNGFRRRTRHRWSVRTRRDARRWRHRRVRRRVRRHSPPPRVRRDPARVTFVLTNNNFWGTVHRGVHLVRSWSAGQMPDSAGSKRGRRTPAAEVATRVGDYLAAGWAARPTPPDTPRGPYFRRPLPRRTRRWQHRHFRRATTGVGRFELNLVGWSRHRNWRGTWKALWTATAGRRRRVRIRVNPARPHNGMRPRRQRRK